MLKQVSRTVRREIRVFAKMMICGFFLSSLRAKCDENPKFQLSGNVL
jgi:hypothetical protein